MILKRHILNTLLVICAFSCFFQTSVFAKDEWIMVQSKNFRLIGNASDKDVRKVATKLEQFREVFVRLFEKANFNAKVPTTVIVFKSASSYKQFKPKRADGKIDEFVAGYFQSGDDVNYITVSTEGEDADTFGTIFHEYVHALLDINIGKSEIPPWFNEGLAEFYQTFKIEDDQKVTLGYPQEGHLQLLQQSQFIPLDTLFNISNYALHQNGNHSRSIFYAESWALIHYLMQGRKTSQADQLGKFLAATMKNVPPEKAFQEVFQMSYAEMEKELKKYVQQRSYFSRLVTFKNKLVFENEMQTSPVSESVADAYLGDLLLHTNRADDAEPFLQKAIAADANLSMAHTSLGMVKLRQRKYEEAKNYLEKAITDDQKNHLAFYKYAYLLSREGRDEFGYVSKFDSPTAAKMRQLLKKAIAINPEFTESYELLAFVNLVNNEELDESIQLLRKALALQPGNQQYAIRIAEIYLRQDKLAEAKQIAEKIAKTASEPEVKSKAEGLLERVKQIEDINAQNEAARKQYEQSIANANKNGGQPMINRRSNSSIAPPRRATPEEIAKAEEEAKLRSINQALRKPESTEKQILGNITKITCLGKTINYAVKTEAEAVTLFSRDFQNLALVSFFTEAENTEVGCNKNLSTIKAVLTFKPATGAKTNILGELVAIDFVPDNFRFISEELATSGSQVNNDSGQTIQNTTGQSVEQTTGQLGVVQESGTPPPDIDLTAARRKSMMEALKKALHQPEADEKHELGLLEKIECDNKGATLTFKTETQVFKFITKSMQSIKLVAFTPEVGQVQFGCGLNQLDIPVIFTYRPNADPKAKSSGELVILEFVPKSFKLEN